ncbi:hypothetical protein DBIPINDM_000941 [Mesorhizobium sp. AR02]|nr:hypothetical protein DBIPINDM_000941 [Mesorhizobium sp. AR02]
MNTSGFELPAVAEGSADTAIAALRDIGVGIPSELENTVGVVIAVLLQGGGMAVVLLLDDAQIAAVVLADAGCVAMSGLTDAGAVQAAIQRIEAESSRHGPDVHTIRRGIPILLAYIERLGRWADAHDTWTSRQIRSLLDPARKETKILAALALLLVAAAWTFFGILEDIVSGDPLVRTDAVFQRTWIPCCPGRVIQRLWKGNQGRWASNRSDQKTIGSRH